MVRVCKVDPCNFVDVFKLLDIHLDVSPKARWNSKQLAVCAGSGDLPRGVTNRSILIQAV